MAINYFISSYRVLYVMIWSFLRYFKNILHNFLETKSTKHQIKKHFGQWTVEKELRLASAIYSTTFARYDDYEIANEWPRSRRVSSWRIVLWWQSTLNKISYDEFFEKRYKNSFCYLSSIRFDGTWICSLTDDGIDALVRSKKKITICVIYIDFISWW